MGLRLIELAPLDVPNLVNEGEILTQALAKEKELKLVTFFKLYNKDIIPLIQEAGGEYDYPGKYIVYTGVKYGTRSDAKRKLIIYAVHAKAIIVKKVELEKKKPTKKAGKKAAKKKSVRKPARKSS
jgi:hypothetical protein